jgi:3-hydroxy-9,10-secoandrosta-1,3,5(10)-triene-9,17-dione monooxygenase
MNLAVGQTIEIPTRETLLERARAIAPDLATERTAANERRDIDPEVIARIDRAGLFNILKPRAFGGYEMDPRVFHEVQNIFAEQCMSTAWVYGVLSIQVFILALLDPRAQRDIWGDGSETALACSSFFPKGSVEVVPGGYRVTGQWPFASGSSFCRWATIGSLVPAADPDAPPIWKLFIVPAEDYTLVDTWRTFGLRATGSNDVRVDGAFVPEHRTWDIAPGLMVAPENGGPPLYRLPWLYMFTSCISNLSIGAGRGAIRAFVQSRRDQPQRPGAFGVDSAPLAVARATAEIEAADLMIRNHVGLMLDHVAAGTSMSEADGLLYRTQLCGVVRRITAVVDELMLLTGGRGIDDEGPLTRTWLDLCAARHHPGNSPESNELMVGAQLMAEM